MTRRLALMGAWTAIAFALFHVGDDLGGCASRLRSSPDDLAWLRMAFGADANQARALASLQATYHRQSEALVAAVEVASQRVATGLDEAGEITPAVRADLAALEVARARSHEMALQHCIQVARVLGPEHGPRYLREMERVLIGLHARHHAHAGRPQHHARLDR